LDPLNAEDAEDAGNIAKYREIVQNFTGDKKTKVKKTELLLEYIYG
jgi:hypothetical protein